MKPTTTSVFASPVRPQTSRSRTIYGLSGRAAGAHRPCLPAAQDGQTKSLPGPAGGNPKLLWGCRLFLLLLFNFLGGLVYANNNAPALTGKSAATAKATAQLAVDKVPPLTGKAPANAKITQKLAETCQQTDDNLAPAMVAIKPGQFQMGSPATETGRSSDEDPQHTVTIPRPFAISRCEITVGQFRQFIQETGYKTTAETDGKGCYRWNTEKKIGNSKRIVVGIVQVLHRPASTL